MSCNVDMCQIGSITLKPTSSVKSISSDRTGVITISYYEKVIPAPQNILTFVPQIDGKIADLSDPANNGKNISWKFGQDNATTIPKKYLPELCR